MKTCLTLFAGGGLADMGIRAAGYTLVGAVERDPAIAAVYAANHGDHVQVAAVEAVEYRPFAGVGAVWASPPCTNASVANPNASESTEDRSMAGAVVRCLQETRPEVFVLENVWGYRTFDSFSLILRALLGMGYRFSVDHVNAANFGVPQTRKRLILRAWRDGSQRSLTATHCEGGARNGLFGDSENLLPWVGWYAAVEDLLPTLPETRFAPWQLERLPERLESLLLTDQTYCHAADGERRAFTVQSESGMRAVLVESRNANQRGDGLREAREPAASLCADGKPSHVPKALLVDCFHTNGRPLAAHAACEPATAEAGSQSRRPMRALLIEGDNLNRNGPFSRWDARPAPAVRTACGPRALLMDSRNCRADGATNLREGDQPAFTTVGSDYRRVSSGPRALLEAGRVVRMTPRALARFQSVPDTYVLPEKNSLACRVVGNGVPPLLAQRIMESLS